MLICPRKNIPTVAREFDELVLATNEDVAYRVWSLNGGNAIDKAPNGAESKLFLTLLDYFKGDRVKAIKAKCAVYSKSFFNWFGDWTGNDVDLETLEKIDYGEVSKVVDENGEPLVVWHASKNTFNIFDKSKIGSGDLLLLSQRFGFNRQSKTVDDSLFFGNSFEELLNGNQASSSSIMNNLLSINSIPHINLILAQVLSKHDVPVLFGKNEFGKPAETIERNGGFVIIIDPELFLLLRTTEATLIFMHEIIHALTVSAFNLPLAIEDKELAIATEKLFSLFEKEMPEFEWSRFDSITGAYILSDKFEFVAEFATNQNSRQVLYEKAVEIDKKYNGKVRLRLKRFINSVTNFLVNKRVFKLKQDEFNDYQKRLKSYLFYKQPIKRGNITDNELLDAIYSTYDFDAADKLRDMDRRVNMIRYFEGMTKHSVEINFPEERQPETTEQKEVKSPDKLRGDIASYLQVRLLSITTSNVFTEEQKSKYSAITKLHINMMTNKNIKSITVFSLFAEDIIPQLLSDLEEVRKLKLTSDSYYMQMYHDNFSTYHKIFSDILDMLNSPDYYNSLLNEIELSDIFDKLGAIKDLSSLKTIVSKASSVSKDGMGHMLWILMNNLKQRAKDISLETGSDEYEKWINEFNTVSYDTRGLLAKWGAKDGSSDPTVRAILHLINKADRLKRDDSYRKLSNLFKLRSALKSGESISYIYETYNGYKTGNVKRRINYGKYKQEEAEMYAQINKLYGLPETNRRIPNDKTLVEYKSLFIEDSKYNYKEDDPKRNKKIPVRRAWNLQKNEWLSLHAERKYNADYYSAYAGLSEEALAAINGVRDMINQIKNKCERDEAGHYLYDSLSPEDWKTLTGLYIQRRLLSSPLKLDGTLKKEGTPEYDIYKELSELNETLYNKDKDYHDKEAWWAAREAKRNLLIEQNTDADGEIDIDAVDKGLKKWDDRNSRRVLKKDGDKILVYKQIDDDIYEITLEDKPVFELNGDGGATYEANELRIRKTLNLFRNPKGEVSLDFLPSRSKKIIKELEEENRTIRKLAIANDKTKKLKKLWDSYKKALKKVRKKYVVTKKTDEYLARHENDIQVLSMDLIQSASDLPRWCRKVVVREDDPELLEKYTELIPGDGWISLEDRNDLLNPEFERLLLMEGNEDENVIPKPSLYDNSTEFEKINSSPTLRAFYDEVVKIIKQSNDLFYNNAKASKYKLPLITGSMLNYAQSQNSRVWKYIKEQIGYNDKGLGVRQDDEFGMNVDSVLDSFLDFSETVNKNSNISVSSLRGSRADDRQFNVIPPRYTTPLDDPSLISPDLIGILYEYYDSAMNVKYKNDIKDEVEAFIDMLEYRTYIKEEKNNSGESTTRQTKGKDTNTYKSARKAADMFLYSIKQEPVKAGNWNLSKSALLLKQATTAINLGASPVVALTGFFTSSYAHMINSIVGDKAYGKMDALEAAGIVLWNGVKTGFGITTLADLNTNNKLMGVMEMFNLVDLLKKKFEKSHQNRALRFLSNNYMFGLLTGTDYVIKSNIMVSLLLSHRFVNGRFIAKEDIRNNARNDSVELYTNKIKEWNEGVSAWDVLEMKDGVIEIKEEYKQAFIDSYDVLYNRIIKTAELADGVATETQKAEITSNLIGAAVLVHRQYLPLQMQDRWSKTVWDMDQLLMKQASFRSALEFLNILTFKSLYAAYKEDGSFIKNYKKNLKSNYTSYFNDSSSDYNYKLSRARRKHLKKVIVELIVYGATFKLLLPLLFSTADDKDNKDKLLLQLAAYVARRTQWETFNAYRPEDAISAIQTVTAETSVIDKLQYFLSEFNPRLTLLGTIFHLVDATNEEDLIKRGVYKGLTKSDKALFKLLPYHNAYEQIFGSKDKRRYYENKIIQINN